MEEQEETEGMEGIIIRLIVLVKLWTPRDRCNEKWNPKCQPFIYVYLHIFTVVCEMTSGLKSVPFSNWPFYWPLF